MLLDKQPVASRGWVTPGAATESVTPLFFPEKPGKLFLVTSSAVLRYHPWFLLLSSSQNRLTFFLLIAVTINIAFYCFHSGVTPSRVSPTPFYLSDLVSPLFFVNSHTHFFLRVSVSPPWRVSPGAVRPPRSS